MKISVMIPTLNEESRIGSLIDYLLANKGDCIIEIIVVDGGSSDRTIEILQNKKVKYKKLENACRAKQLNYGASMATGEVFYFVHADTYPPKTFTECIKSAIFNGFTSGCCAYEFDSNKKTLKLNSFFTQFKGFHTGGGDQTLFVTKAIYNRLEGFNSEYTIMEDFEFTKRLRKISNYTILKSKALVSARKYDHNSFLRVNIANLIAMIMFKIDFKPQRIQSAYKKIIRYHGFN